MNKEIPQTEKLYYENQNISSTQATVLKTSENILIMNKTPIFPEGGGQESDHGWIKTSTKTLRVIQAKLINGTPIRLDGFKGGVHGGHIVHEIHQDDRHLVNEIQIGDRVDVLIDTVRRQKLTVSHSASHFLYASALSLREDLQSKTIGCHIKEDSARFDFWTHAFSPDEIRIIEEQANSMIMSGTTIRMESHPEISDARTWVFGEIRIPCGGTHLTSPEEIGTIRVKRRGIGKSKERLICILENTSINTRHYFPHE